jgi:hypothetical protein
MLFMRYYKVSFTNKLAERDFTSAILNLTSMYSGLTFLFPAFSYSRKKYALSKNCFHKIDGLTGKCFLKTRFLTVQILLGIEFLLLFFQLTCNQSFFSFLPKKRM